jgi:hypothetical protein
MSETISTFYTQSYATNVALLSQQRESRLAKAVTIGHYKGKAASPVEQLGPVVAQKRTGRLEPVEFGSSPTDRPWVYPSDYDYYEAVDSIDKLRMVVDPQSAIVQNFVSALNRRKDDEIIAAFFATRKKGESGGTTQSFPSAQQVSVNTGGTGSGLNVAKLRAAKKLLMAAEVDLDTDEIWCALTAAQHDNLLNEVQVVSTDFNDRPVLVDGKVTRFLGINFIHTERLATNGSSQRRIPVWAKSGMHLGVWNDITTSIDPRPDLKGKPIQVGGSLTIGATRLEEAKVVELPCAES